MRYSGDLLTKEQTKYRLSVWSGSREIEKERVPSQTYPDKFHMTVNLNLCLR